MAAYAIQFRRGTTTEHSSFTGLLGEVTVDTTKKSLVVHDGSTAGGFALALDGAATSTTTGTFSSNVTVGGTLAVSSTSTMGGDLTMTGDILPSANVTYDLGSSTMMWKDIYVGPGSLYVNGKKVIEDDSGAINITTDVNEDLKLTTTGTGTLKLISGNGINITGELGATSGDLQIGDHMDMNSNLIKEVATPVSTTDAANKAYVDSAASSAVTGGSNAVSGTTGAFSSNVTVGGNLTVSGTTTTINTAQINIADNIIVLNSDATGSASVNAGFEIERGDDANKQLLWNETNDRWSLQSEDIDAANFIGGLTGNVSGNVTGDVTGDLTGSVTGNVTGNITGATSGVHTGAVTGDVTGNVTGNASGSAGTVTSIAGHLLDEDNMVSDSATKVPSQQSVKAYVASQVATKDNTDEMTEGSTNLYFTDARADARTAVSTATNTTAWEAYADQAEADAETAAISTAESKDVARMITSDAYTDTAEAAAIASASSTAESKDVARMITSDAYADASEAAAISTASADATSKADAAEADAIASAASTAESKDVARMVTSDAYADASEAAAISTASADATSKADAAEADAIASAESKDAVRATAANNYADASEAAAISSAESKDAVRATAANDYADAAVAAIVNGAPASLDTLNELAAAIADDASYSTTLTTLVGTKLAKAGGTMSGDINMGGNDITNASAMTATNFHGQATTALYADLAERYAADATYEEGTVVMFGGEAEVTSAQGYGSTKIAGVVSTKPAFAMNSEAGNSETHPYIALQGRVPCKVIGTVSKGDLLVASETSGVATVWLESSVDPRMTAYVGIAIEDKTTDGAGYVEVKVGK